MKSAKALAARAAKMQSRAGNQLVSAYKKLQKITTTPDSVKVEAWASNAKFCNETAVAYFKKTIMIAGEANKKARMVMQLDDGMNAKLFSNEIQEAGKMIEETNEIIQKSAGLLMQMPKKIISQKYEEVLQRFRKGGLHSFNKMADSIESGLASIRIEGKRAGSAMILAKQKGLGDATSNYKFREAKECVQKIMKKVRNVTAWVASMQEIIEGERRSVGDDAAEDVDDDAYMEQLSTIAEMQERVAELKQKVAKSDEFAVALESKISQTPNTKEKSKPSRKRSQITA